MENTSFRSRPRDVVSTERPALVDVGHRQSAVYYLMLALLKYLSIFSHEGKIEIWRIATRLEENIFTEVTDEHMYAKEINMEIQSILWKANEDIQRQHDRVAILSSNSLSLSPQRCSNMLQQQNNVRPQMQSIMQIGSNAEDPSGGTDDSCLIDKISNLSDDLLQSILSLLPAKEVMHTSVLSTRWRHLWTSVPRLNIHEDQFGVEEERFNQFVNAILLKRCAPLEKFCLYSVGTGHTNFWINLALENNAKDIEFCDTRRDFEPPILDSSIIDFSIGCLKTLKLDHVLVPSDVFDTLNNSCPSLEELRLALCIVEGPDICSSSLVNLALVSCSIFVDLIICSPKLVYLHIENPRYRCPSTSKLLSLETASISLDNHMHGNADEEDMELYHSHVLGGLSNVKTLELRAPIGEVTFEWEIGEWCTASSFYPLTCFLRCSPQLRNLTILLNMHSCEHCLALEQGPLPKGGSFTSNHLKKVEIKYVKGHKDLVDKLVKMLHDNAKSIEELCAEEVEEPNAESVEEIEPNAELSIEEIEPSC